MRSISNSTIIVSMPCLSHWIRMKKIIKKTEKTPPPKIILINDFLIGIDLDLNIKVLNQAEINKMSPKSYNQIECSQLEAYIA